MVKAIFFDIDGTLVSFKTHQVAKENLCYIKKVKRKKDISYLLLQEEGKMV